MVHRDVKPSNALLCFDAGSCRLGDYTRAVLKMSDLGSARALPLEAPCRIRSKTPCFFDGKAFRSMEHQFDMTARVSTAFWRAPELIRNSSTADQVDGVVGSDELEELALYGVQIDVWSYGATVYEMLACKRLAASSSGAGLLRCLLERAPEPCPYPCSDAGLLDSVPVYMTENGWEELFLAAQQGGPSSANRGGRAKSGMLLLRACAGIPGPG